MTAGPLEGVRIVEMGSIGPAPFCGMHFADLGADVIIIEREAAGAERQDTAPGAILRRGKRSVALNLKDSENIKIALSIISTADGLIEGMRPGVMERLGIGPEACLAVNPKLVFGRITGWGQTGPLSHLAGHDLNYIGLSGAAWYSGAPGSAPVPPPTVIGDIGGGALYLMIGLLAGIMRARRTGRGDVVDAAIVDGSAHMMNLLLDVTFKQHRECRRGNTSLDGAHFYRAYLCADGKYVSVGCLEPKFYFEFISIIGLQDDENLQQQFRTDLWAENAAILGAVFATKSRDEWCELFAGTDACVGPILSPEEAARNPHMRSRRIYSEANGQIEARSAPRFLMSESVYASTSAPGIGQHTQEILAELAESKG